MVGGGGWNQVERNLDVVQMLAKEMPKWRETSASALLNCGESTVWLKRTIVFYWRNGMSTSQLSSGERVRDVRCTDDTLAVDLADGRTIIVPLAWYPRLLDATQEQRSHWKVSGTGYGIHWPDIDEDLSTEGLLRGAPAAAEPARLRSWRQSE
jgi:hypothetical protein